MESCSNALVAHLKKTKTPKLVCRFLTLSVATLGTGNY